MSFLKLGSVLVGLSLNRGVLTFFFESQYSQIAVLMSNVCFGL